MIRTNTYLRKDQDEALEQIIKDTGFGKKAQLVRKAVDEYIGKYRKYPTVNNVCSIPPQQFISPGVPLWSEPFPNPSHVGRRVKVVKGNHAGRIGIVTDHWINADDCSGEYGHHLYQLEGDLERYGCKNNSCAINVKDCEFID